MRKMKILSCLMLLAVVSTFTVGCKSYEEAEYVEAKANETVFVAKLDGEKQAVKFDSAESLQKLQVAAKRVPIPHVFQQTGRMGSSGYWKPSVAIYIVNRSPVTREWLAEAGKGTSNKDEGIWAESKDSVGFSTGVTISAMIEEQDAALFLYRYPTGASKTNKVEGGLLRVDKNVSALSPVMDNEIRSKIQAVFSDFAAMFDMSDLRDQKVQIVEKLRTEIVPFFKTRGITITNIGLTGGFTYENKKIQDAIDNVFVAQREKEVNKAKLDAQLDANKRVEMEALAVAEALRTKAQAEADAILMSKKAEADGQTLLLAVAKEAGQNEAFLKLRQLDVEMLKAKNWNGVMPTMLIGSGGEMPTMLMPLPQATK